MDLIVIDKMHPLKVTTRLEANGKITINVDVDKFGKELDQVFVFTIQECMRLCKNKADKAKIKAHFGI